MSESCFRGYLDSSAHRVMFPHCYWSFETECVAGAWAFNLPEAEHVAGAWAFNLPEAERVAGAWAFNLPAKIDRPLFAYHWEINHFW
jgi:hypothetical protein